MILGPSGTGKSVCIKHMVGLLYPDEGEVLVHGESVPAMADDELFEMRKKFGVLFQDGALFGSMNGSRQHRLPSAPAHGQGGGRDPRDRHAPPGRGGSGRCRGQDAQRAVRRMRKRAASLVLDPDIVLFDEPDSGLDPSSDRAPL